MEIKINIFKEVNEIWTITKKILIAILFGLIITFGVSLLCGFQYKIVRTGSMTPRLPIFTMVMLEPTDYDELKIGDIITYGSRSANSEYTYTHRVVKFAENGNVITKGDAATMEENVSRERYIGRVVFDSYPIGRLIVFVRENIIIVGVAMMILLMWYAFS